MSLAWPDLVQNDSDSAPNWPLGGENDEENNQTTEAVFVCHEEFEAATGWVTEAQYWIEGISIIVVGIFGKQNTHFWGQKVAENVSHFVPVPRLFSQGLGLNMYRV